jgi:hypothetical protein
MKKLIYSILILALATASYWGYSRFKSDASVNSGAVLENVVSTAAPLSTQNGSLLSSQNPSNIGGLGSAKQIDMLFSAPSAVSAVKLLPQLDNIDPQTKASMVGEINALCFLKTAKFAQKDLWLSQSINDYCVGFPLMSMEQFQKHADQTKGSHIAKALQTIREKDGASAFNDSIATLIATSHDPYEREEAFMQAAEHGAEFGLSQLPPEKFSPQRIRDALTLAGYISFCEDHSSACRANGLRSLGACASFGDCKQPTPILDQLKYKSSPEEYEAVTKLIAEIKAKY